MWLSNEYVETVYTAKSPLAFGIAGPLRGAESKTLHLISFETIYSERLYVGLNISVSVENGFQTSAPTLLTTLPPPIADLVTLLHCCQCKSRGPSGERT